MPNVTALPRTSMHPPCAAQQGRGAGASLLSLAVIYDSGSRTEAARLANVMLQIVCDWVVWFNAEGPDELRDRKTPGPTPLLNTADRAALLEIIERGLTPAVHGVVRWRVTDLASGCGRSSISRSHRRRRADSTG